MVFAPSTLRCPPFGDGAQAPPPQRARKGLVYPHTILESVVLPQLTVGMPSTVTAITLTVLEATIQ